MPIESLAGRFSALSRQGLRKISSQAAESIENNEVSSSLTRVKTSNHSSSDQTSNKSKDRKGLLAILWPSISDKPVGLTIKLVSWEMFRDICKRFKLKGGPGGDFSGTPFTASEMRRLRSKSYTRGAFDCNTGTIMNFSKGTLFHLDPKDMTESERAEIEKFLLEDSAVLGKKGPVRGFISGGQRVRSRESRPLRDFLVSVFRKGDIQNISQIWGQNYGFITTDLIMDAKNRTVYLLAEADNRYSLTLQDLMAHYERIFLAPGDVLEAANGQKYAALDIVNGKPNTLTG